MSTRLGSAAPSRPGVLKIHSHSAQFSFWTVALDANTRAVDIVTVVANKIRLPPEHVFLYEVGDNKGLQIERKLAPEELIEPLHKKWTAEKSNKKFSINVEGINLERLRMGAKADGDKRASGSYNPVLEVLPNEDRAPSPMLRSVSTAAVMTTSDKSRLSSRIERPAPVGDVESSSSPAHLPMPTSVSSAAVMSTPAPASPAGQSQDTVTTTYIADVKPQTYMVEEVRPARSAAAQRAIISPSMAALLNDKRTVLPTPTQPVAPTPSVSVRYDSPGPRRPMIVPSNSTSAIILTAANARPSPNPSPARLQPSMSFSGQTVPQPQVAVFGKSLKDLHDSQRSPSPSIRNSTPTRVGARHDDTSFNASVADTLDPMLLSDFTAKLRNAVAALSFPAAGQLELYITPDIVLQLDGVFTAAFNRPPNGSDYGKIFAIVTQGDDTAKEHCLRILTHITLQIDNQKAVAASGLFRPLVTLLSTSTSQVQMLSAWTVSNLATSEANKDKLRESIPGLLLILTTSFAPAIEQSLRAFANLLKGNEANKAIFMRHHGVPLTVYLLKRKELGDNVMVLALRTLMLLTWNAETKAGAFSAGGLQSVLDLLNHANAGERKMASWIANNMVVDGSVNDDVRRLGGIAPMVKLLSEADPFVKEQAVTVLANLAVNETNLDPLRDAGGLKGLLAVAAAKESSDNLRLKAVWALSNAVVSDENQVAFQDLGGIKFLMHFLANPNVKVQVRAAAACVNLTQSSDPCRAEIGASGGVARLVQCLAVNAPELEEHAMKAFVNLSLCAANEDRFINEALDALLAKVQSQNVTTQEYALMTLANLALNDRVRNEVRDRNGLVPVVMVFLNPPTEVSRFQSLKLITNLSINGKNRAFLSKKGLIPRVNAFMDTNCDPAARELATMAYANLTFPTEELTGPVNEHMKAMIEEGERKRMTAVIHRGATAKPASTPTLLDIPSSGSSYNIRGPRVKENTDLFAQQREEAEAELRALQREREEYLASVRRDEKKKEEALKVKEEMRKAEEDAKNAASPAVAKQLREKSMKLQAQHELLAAEEDVRQKEKLAAMIEKRGRIAAEILVSERTYVESLGTMIKKYMNPMLAAAQSKKPPLQELQVKKIFSISELILNFHSMFLEGLEARILSWSEETLIGDYFLRMAEFLRCYTQYVNNYDTAMKILEDLEKKPLFLQLLQKCTDNTEVKGLALYSYLIMPIQRPPRYELLLADLLKNTASEHPDHTNIKSAQQLICDINAQVDEKKRVNDEKKRVVEIDKSVGGQPAGETLVAAHRNFIFEGDLVSGADRFHVFLFTDLIVFTKAHPQPKKRDSAIGVPDAHPVLWDFVMRLPLAECTLSEASSFQDNSEAAFRLQQSNMSLLLLCNSAADRDSWFVKISDALAGLKDLENKRRSVRLT